MRTFRDLWEQALDRHSFNEWWRRECKDRFADQDPLPDYYKNLRAENIKRAKNARSK